MHRFIVKHSIAGWVAWVVDTKTWKTLSFTSGMNEHGTADGSAEKEAALCAIFLNRIVNGGVL